MTKRASDWLNDRLSGLKKGLEQSERTLQEYRDRERIVDTKGLAQAGATKQIEDLTKTLIESRQKRAEAENAFNQIKDAKEYNSLPVVMRNPLVARLKELENESEKKVAELSQRYGPEHVRMIQATGELKQMRENTRRQIEVVVASLTKEYEAARANEAAVVRTMGEAKGFVQGMNRKEFQLGALEREVSTNRQIYDMFVNRFKETNAASDMQSNVVARVIDPATPSDRPIKPNKQQIILIAFVLGLFLGVMVALLLERLDNTIKSGDDVETKLAQPVLTMLPIITGRAAKKAAGTQYLLDPKSIFSEAIRTARTSVLLSAIDTPNKILVVTSSVPDEGKTTFAVNLALAHAQTKRVLLIDADMRRPSLAKHLHLDTANPGLSTLVSGTAKFDDCVQAVDGSTLHVITSGPIPPNPLELILAHRFKEVLQMCEKEYDIIIIDSPPVQLVSDAVVLSTMATGVLFVVKADSTPYQLARRGIRTLLEADATLFGVTLNQLDFKKADRYYGAHTGYSKYNYEGYYTKAG
jgi:capsular exopolysaccharide synthesis family protein